MAEQIFPKGLQPMEGPHWGRGREGRSSREPQSSPAPLVASLKGPSATRGDNKGESRGVWSEAEPGNGGGGVSSPSVLMLASFFVFVSQYLNQSLNICINQ